MSEAAALPVDLAAERPTLVRWGVVLLTGLLAIVIYLHRSCIANASKIIEADLQINDQQMGFIKAAFSCGYLFQFVGALLNSRFSNRFVLAGMAVASAAGLVGASQSRSATELWICMACIGLAQAGVIPCVGQVVRDWMPANRRATAGAVFTGCMSMGSAVASSMTGFLLKIHLSWRLAFLGYAGLGVLWAIVFGWWFRDRAAKHAQVNDAELQLIEADCGRGGTAVPRADAAVWFAMLSCRNQWFGCLQQFFRNFAFTFFITWYPSFLVNAYEVTIEDANLMSTVPFITAFLGILAGGQLVDFVFNRTGSRYLSRSATSAIGQFLCAIVFLCAAATSDPWINAGLIGFAMIFFGVGSPATWAATMDIAGRFTTLFFALMNAVGVVAGIVSPIVVGFMTQRIKEGYGDWNQILYLFAVINALAAVCWLCINSEYPANLPPEPEADGPRPVGAAGT